VSTALEVVSAAGVEGHLPVPGSVVLRRARRQPGRVEAVSGTSATLCNFASVVSLKSLGGQVRENVICELPAWDCWTGTVNG